MPYGVSVGQLVLPIQRTLQPSNYFGERRDNGEMAGSSTQQANGAQADVAGAVGDATEQVQEQVVNLGHQVREQATQQVATQKDRVADTLETVALLLQQAGEHAEQQDKAMIGQYADKAADQVSQWSETLRQQDVTQLMDTTMQFARKQPMLFVSGALAAGFAGARFLRASAQQSGPDTSNGSSDSTPTAETPVGDLAGGDLPPYDIDQPMATDAGLDPLLDDQSILTDQEPGLADLLHTYETASLEGEMELPTAGLAMGDDDQTGTGQV